LERGLLHQGLWETGKRRLWKWSVSLLGALRGNVEGGSFTGDFERYVKEGSGDWHLSP
jgi:hypothetical protein